MASAPGYVGLPIVGDKSVEFYKNAVHFVDKRIHQHKSRIFATRLLNKHTVFIASNKGVHELLHEKATYTELGYRSFMHQIYGDNILFTDGDEAFACRDALHKILSSEDAFGHFEQNLHRLVQKYFGSLESKEQGNGLPIYTLCKKFATEVCLTTFLSLDFEQSADVAEKIVSLTTTHWHGIISVPFNLKLPMLNKSTYGQALDAKEKLLEIIQNKMKGCTTGIPQTVKETDFGKPEGGANHVLLFTSALVPKAIASILTSFIITLANKKSYIREARGNADFLENLLLETMRVYPPLLGGRRVAKEDFIVQGTKISAGQAVVYMTRHAQRDPELFVDPDEFIPSRWANRNSGDRDKLFVLGGGSRDCVGKHMVWKILKVVCGKLVDSYAWDLHQNQDLLYKWLPVSRPKAEISCEFTRCDSSPGTGGAPHIPEGAHEDQNFLS